MRALQMRRVEGTRKKIERALTFDLALKIGKYHRNVTAEFPDDLPAGAARRCERVGVGKDCDGLEFVRAFAFRERLEDGDAFGAESEPVAGIFDIAAAEDASGLCAQGSTNAKFREGRMSVLTGGAGDGDELVVSGHERDYAPKSARAV